MDVIIGGTYKHFKGHMVKVIAIGKHSETKEDLVVYEKLEDGDGYKKGDVWIRPLSMFTEIVNRNGISQPRFELQDSLLL